VQETEMTCVMFEGSFPQSESADFTASSASFGAASL